MKILILLLTLSGHYSFAADTNPPLPASHVRKAIVLELSEEMIRIDAEGLIVREGGAERFKRLANVVAEESEMAQNWTEFFRALKRLDQSYTNLHSRFDPGTKISLDRNIIPVVGFSAEWLAPGITQHRISRVDPNHFPSETGPKIGDIVLAINGRLIQNWKKDYFDFCKWAFKELCDLRFNSDFYNELAGWSRNDPLSYTLQRGDLIWTQTIPLKEREAMNGDEWRLCANSPNRYNGFHLIHAGKFACFYEKDTDPSTLLLRITSFSYNRKVINDGPQSVREEVEAFWPLWKNRAPFTKKLVIDVSNNGGGNALAAYYSVFFTKPYQEQYGQFKKIPELEDPILRKAFFWESVGQEIWFQNIKKEGIWDSTPYGEFLPPVPMFCAIHNRDCREGLFPVRSHGFKGNVSIIVNGGCVSSCDAFVYTFKQELGERVKLIGQPQAADTTYSRIRIGVELDSTQPKGFRLHMLPQYGDLPETILFSQIATVTRSVKADGTIVSGKPLPVDIFIPSTLERNELWHMDAVNAALENKTF